MKFDHRTRHAGIGGASAEPGALEAGKRSLTEQLPMQNRVVGGAVGGTPSSNTSATEPSAAAPGGASAVTMEEWRKKGAAKQFRAILRLVAAGKLTLSHGLSAKYFHFVKSADAGRRQIGQIQDVHHGHATKASLDKPTRQVMNNMSPIRDGDLSSDDEERGKKAMSTKRIFSKFEKQKAKDKAKDQANHKADHSDDDMGGDDGGGGGAGAASGAGPAGGAASS